MATKEELEKIKRRSAAYWKKRAKELEEASFNRGMRTYRDIEEAYDQAQRSINKEIEKWYYRIAENNDLTLDGARKLLRANELEEFKWDVKEYIKAGKENAVNQSWMKELENASGRYHISRLEALKIETQQALELAFGNEVDAIDKMARRTIDEDYLKTCYELQKGIGVGWPVGTIDNRTLDKIVTKPWAADGANFSDRIWTNKTKMVDTLHQNLTRACILGQSPDKAIAALTQFVDKSISNAKRAAATLVQTEQAYFHAKAQQEAYTAIGVEEFEVVATLDSHTSEICQEMDGEHFPMSQYEIGTTVPPFHPRCRSVTAPYFEDDFGVSGQRAARGDDADATYYVPENMTYKEWKEEQRTHEKPLEEKKESGIIKLALVTDEKAILFDKSDVMFNEALSVEPEAGYYDIFGHGNPDVVELNIDGKKKLLNADQLVEYLKSIGHDKDDIRFAACSTGEGENPIAQKVSKTLGIRTKAPIKEVYYDAKDSTVHVGKPWETGGWRVFNKGVEEK